MSFDVTAFRAEFAIFSERPDLLYFDSAATMQTPEAVLQAQLNFYRQQKANVHRSAHQLSQIATQAFEHARDTVAAFINAPARHSVIWSSGATAALNQIAFGLMGSVLQAGDRILLTTLEHHANIVPWQFHCQQHGVIIDVVPLTPDHRLDLEAFQQLLQRQPKVVSFTHVSNVLGHILPLTSLIEQAQAAGALTVIDGAQGILYEVPDVQQLDCDFYVFSGHKVYGPTGIGVLYGKPSSLELLRPLHYGGEMIQSVSFQQTTLQQLPYRLEAGTPNIAGAIGLAAAIQWLKAWDWQAMQQHKQALLFQLFEHMSVLPGIDLLSRRYDNAGILAFNLRGEHATDVALLFDQQQIALRAGTHCAMPLFQAIKQQGAVRLSLAPYNTVHEIEEFILALHTTLEMFA